MTTSTTTSPLLARPGAVEGQGADAGRRRALRRPDARAAPARRGAGGGRPVAPRGRHGHRPRPADLAALDDDPAARSGSRRASRASRSSCRPRGTSSTRCTSSTTARPRGSPSSPGTAPALVAWLESMRFMLRVEVADVTADWAVLGEPLGAESAPGEPLAWVDPWPALVGDTTAYGPVEDHPAARPRLARAHRAARRPRGGRRRPAARRHLGRRGAARRGLAAAARVRDRPPHHPARGRLAAHGRAPAQGLLPRSGDDRARAQPRPPAAAPGLPAPRRVGARAAGRRAAGRCSASAWSGG